MHDAQVAVCCAKQITPLANLHGPNLQAKSSAVIPDACDHACSVRPGVPGAYLQQPLLQAAADQGSAAAWVAVRDTGKVRQRMVRREPAGQPGRDPPRRGVQGLSVDAELTVCVQGIHVLAVPLKQLHLRTRQPG